MNIEKQSATPSSADVGTRSMINVDGNSGRKKDKPVAKPHKELMRDGESVTLWRTSVALQEACPEGQTQVISHEIMRLPSGSAFRDRPMCVNNDTVPHHIDRAAVVNVIKTYMGEG